MKVNKTGQSETGHKDMPFDDSGQSPGGKMRLLREYLVKSRDRHQVGRESFFDLAVGDPRVEPFPPARDRSVRFLKSDRIVYYPNPVGENRSELVPFALQHGLIDSEDTGSGLEGHVLPCVGSAQGFTLFAKSQFGSSDIILFPRPSFTYFTIQAEDAGAEVEFLDLKPETGYRLTAAAIRSRLDELALAGKQVTVLYLATPDNPTGATLTCREAADIAALARERDLLVLHDAAYYGTEYGHERDVFLARWAPERTVTLFTLSKAFGFAGLRAGFCVGPKPIIGAMAELLEDTVDSVCLVAQEALQCCFSMEQEIVSARENYFRKNARRHVLHGALTRALAGSADIAELPSEQAQWIRSMLDETVGEPESAYLLEGVPGMSVLSSEQASFVLLADVAPLIDRLPGISSSAELASFLMKAAGVRLMPGEGFHTLGTVRISFSPSPSEIIAGFLSIRRAIDAALSQS